MIEGFVAAGDQDAAQGLENPWVAVGMDEEAGNEVEEGHQVLDAGAAAEPGAQLCLDGLGQANDVGAVLLDAEEEVEVGAGLGEEGGEVELGREAGADPVGDLAVCDLADVVGSPLGRRSFGGVGARHGGPMTG